MDEFIKDFSGLLFLYDDLLRLNSKTTLGEYDLEVAYMTDFSLGLRCKGIDEIINLTLYKKLPNISTELSSKRGFLTMEPDLYLSDSACIYIYSYNIEIVVSDKGGLSKFYDKDAIMRRHTINSIIN